MSNNTTSNRRMSRHKKELVRSQTGQIQPRITDGEVRAIRERRATGEAIATIATDYNLPRPYVSSLTLGKRRRGAGGPISALHAHNAGRSRFVVDGQAQGIRIAAEKAGLPLSAVSSRLYRGYSEHDALALELVDDQPLPVIYPPGPSIAYLPVTRTGAFACIDVESIPLVQNRRWHAFVNVVGTPRPRAQTAIAVDGKTQWIQLTRWIAPFEAPVVDAINHNYLDARLANLRPIRKAQSCWRASRRKNNTSGATGVSWSASKQRWIALLVCDYKTVHRSTHYTFAEAKAARDRAVAIYRGEFVEALSEVEVI